MYLETHDLRNGIVSVHLTGSRRSDNVVNYVGFAVRGVDEDDLTAAIKQIVQALGGEIEPCDYGPDADTVEGAIDPERTFGGLIDLSPLRPDEVI